MCDNARWIHGLSQVERWMGTSFGDTGVMKVMIRWCGVDRNDIYYKDNKKMV